MSGKMQVLFAKRTGHVMAAFTRAADPEGKLNVSDLAGSGLLVRRKKMVMGGGEILTVPPEALDVSVIDLEPAVFNSPREFVVGGGQVAKLGANPLNLSPASVSVPVTSPTSTSSPPVLNFSPTRVTVVLDLDAADDVGVCVFLEEFSPAPGVEPVRRVAQGAITKGTHFVSLKWKSSPDGVDASIPDPTTLFLILALVAGYQPHFGARVPSTT